MVTESLVSSVSMHSMSSSNSLRIPSGRHSTVSFRHQIHKWWLRFHIHNTSFWLFAYKQVQQVDWLGWWRFEAVLFWNSNPKLDRSYKLNACVLYGVIVRMKALAWLRSFWNECHWLRLTFNLSFMLAHHKRLISGPKSVKNSSRGDAIVQRWYGRRRANCPFHFCFDLQRTCNVSCHIAVFDASFKGN